MPIVGPILDMTRKIIFTMPFYRACEALLLCLLGCYIVGL
jgi:uncharacterized membrane protein